MMYEWDGWFNGGDDLICDTDYYEVYDELGDHNLATTDIYVERFGANETGDYRTLVDGWISNESEIVMKME